MKRSSCLMGLFYASWLFNIVAAHVCIPYPPVCFIFVHPLILIGILVRRRWRNNDGAQTNS